MAETHLPPITVVPAKPAESTRTTAAESLTWWERYRANASEHLTESALEILEHDARYIVDKAIPFDDAGPQGNAWPAEGVRTGMVVGSVQSGKTANMLGVASLALDRGVDLIVLLAGTRVGLWLQTYERMLTQLDGSTLDTAQERDRERLILPQPLDVLLNDRLRPTQYLKQSKATLAVRNQHPMIFVIPKVDEHLNQLSRMLKAVYSNEELDGRSKPVTLLVLDDEADDASVLDSYSSEKITPRFINSLWSGSHHCSDSRHSKLLASYVAYTATPQANYLQESHNPLAPRHFSAALRVPGRTGAKEPRDLTYVEPSGLKGYYCGGDLFYEELAQQSHPLAIPFDFPVRSPGEPDERFAARVDRLRWEMISTSMRHYLVAGAARLLLQGKSLNKIRGQTFSSPEEMQGCLPDAHSMLFHPSARKELHFYAARDLTAWARSLPGQEDQAVLPEDDNGNPILALDPEGIERRILAEEQKWKECLAAFEDTRVALSSYPRAGFQSLDQSRWSEVKRLLIEEVAPNVSIRVLNSDPAADDRPQFKPMYGDGKWSPPPDIYTIFVAGNVLSRGLTVDGLSVSLFLRSSSEPAADTQMQMQRWFGYRGKHLPFCRVFLLADQLALFRQYNQRDKALKSQLLKRMASADEAHAAHTLILEGESFVATGKVETRKVPLSPGPSPQLRLLERADPIAAKANVDIVKAVLREGTWQTIDPSRKIGLIRSEPASLNEVADLLDQFRYSRHDPDPDLELSRRWESIRESLDQDAPLFRPPGRDPKQYFVRPQGCPYSIAAYFRLWSALTTGGFASGFHATDRGELPWSQLDAKVIPHFYLAIRSGDHPCTDPILNQSKIKAMERGIGDSDRLKTLWGSRGYGGGSHGDQFIDYHFHNCRPVPSLEGGATWRPRGHPGLMLFHVIKDDQGGPDMVTVGLGLPHGGPDHIAALRR